MRLNLLQRIPRMYFFTLAAAAGCMAMSGCDASVAQDDSSETAAQEEGQETAEDQPAEEAAENDGKEGEKEEKLQELKLAEGRLVLQAPARWEKQPPRSRITEVELKVPPVKEAKPKKAPAAKPAAA